MTIRHILVALTGARHEEHVPAIAMRLAKRLTAHVAVACTVADRPVVYDMTGVPAGPGYLDELNQAVETARSGMRGEARRIFETAALEVKLPLIESMRGEASAWYVGAADRDALIGEIGRLTDLVIGCRPQGVGMLAEEEIVEDVLFILHRPVLILPGPVKEIGSTVMVAWDGGLEAANALRACIPLLMPEAKVTLLQIGELATNGASVEAAAEYLGWHGFATQIRRVEDAGKKTPDVILSEAKAAGANLLVLGAYSHSRMREILLGGVTATMLIHAEMPVLMAH